MERILEPLLARALRRRTSTDVFGPGGSSNDVTRPEVSSTAFVSVGTPPIAVAGPDQSVIPGAPIILDGSGSSDPSGGYPLVYSWGQLQQPGLPWWSMPPSEKWFAPGTDLSQATVTLIPQHGVGTFYLVVRNSMGQYGIDFVTITGNTPPVANAGPDQSVSAGSVVQLNGAGSSDADGDTLTYNWTLISQPQFSTSTITSDPNNPGLANFTADWSGTYQVQLVVNDGYVDSAPSTMNVTVTPSQVGTIDNMGTLMNVTENLGTLPLSASVQYAALSTTPSTNQVWKSPEMRAAMLNKLAVVSKDVQKGNYHAASNQLQNDVLTKMDGCARTGAPDSNDWIISAAAQGQVYPLVTYVIGELNLLS